MRLFKFLKKSQKKSYSQQSYQNNLMSTTRESFVDQLLGNRNYDLANYTLLNLYNICAPVSDAVDTLSQEIANIDPVVFDTKTKEFIYDHPVLDLLKRPNPVDIYYSLIQRIITFYVVTGNSYFLSMGDIKRPPLEFFVVSPSNISISSERNGFVDSYLLTQNTSGSMGYKQKENEGRFRYYNIVGNQELFHVKRFGQRGAFTPTQGVSMLHSIYYEIEQYINSGVHNLSILLRGGSLSGIISTKEDQLLTDDQRERIKEELHNFIEGSKNAGRIGFFDSPITYDSLGNTNKDMDFYKLKKDVELMIYKRLKIPPALVNEDSMTLSNLESSRLLLYDNAVLPIANRMFAELTSFLMYRYEDSENKIITFDISEIPALEPRKIDQLKKINEMNILTRNEQRADIGYEEIDEGDDVLVPANLVPIGFSDENNINNDDTTKKSATKLEFISLMTQQVNADGERRYSDDEIEEIASREGLK